MISKTHKIKIILSEEVGLKSLMSILKKELNDYKINIDYEVLR